MKKGQGLSMNMIVITAVALIVLVVLIAIFTGQMGDFSSGVRDSGECQNVGGTCVDLENVDGREIIGRTGLGCEEDQVCVRVE